ncbi:MAG: helix-turn-helix domain-containing protein [Saprospiraceae bacterium]|nr:MAG: helix-turn-helix domain-containing protein [Saprospiraceae bacterium]
MDATDIRYRLGQRIKQLREVKGMSQKDLAYTADLDRSYIAGVEAGSRNVSIVNVEKIANALNVSLNEFFDADEFNHTTVPR